MDLSHNASPRTSQDTTERILTTHIDYEAVKRHLESLSDSDGVSRLTDIQVMRTLALCNCVAKPMTAEEEKKRRLPSGSHWTKSGFLETFYKNYTKLLELLEGNEVIIFRYKEYIKKGEIKVGIVRYATVNPIYIKECKVRLSETDYKHMNIHYRKLSKYGKAHSTNSDVSIDVDYDTFRSEVTEYLESRPDFSGYEDLENTLQTQWKAIERTNATGRINPIKPIKGRNSSRITVISHPMNKYIKLEGEDTTEFDQHATYLTLLPQILLVRVSVKIRPTDFMENIIRLKNLIKTEPNLYIYIANYLNVSVLSIKQEVNKFFCDPNAPRTYQYKFFEFFQQEFPALNESILMLRCKNGPYSDFNRIESSIFSGAAKDLLKIGIPAVTKYDSLIVKIKDSEKAKEILNERFNKAGVINRTKETRGTQTILKPQNGDSEKENGRGQQEPQGATEHTGTLLSPEWTNDTKIRKVNNNGSEAWMYRGTGTQQLKKSCKKFTREQFVELINQKFTTGEWK